MKRLASRRTRGKPANHMTSNLKNTQQVVSQQDTNSQFSHIYLGLDLHKQTISVTRIIDHGTPQPAQRFSWTKLRTFLEKQKLLAQKVHLVYEAGAFGFWLCRELQAQDIAAYVVHPEKLDPRHRRVQTDRSDSLHLALQLQRYVLGNKKAMTPVYVPTPAQEQQRLVARHRDDLSERILSLKARGQGLLLSQGQFNTARWYEAKNWSKLQPQLTPELALVLESLRASINHFSQQLAIVQKQLEGAAPKTLPLGFGQLTFVLLQRLLCSYERFKSRRQVAGFTGLCGGVSSSGSYHRDLSINKSGNPRVRTLLIELAWRMIYYQPSYTGLRTWKRLGGPGAAKRRRKIALVATARQLLVDIWRWQTGRVTPEELGWRMVPA
jgi:transposase